MPSVNIPDLKFIEKICCDFRCNVGNQRNFYKNWNKAAITIRECNEIS